LPTDISDGVHHQVVDTIIAPLFRQLSPTSRSTPDGRCRGDSVFETYDDINDAACNAWNNLTAQPAVITSIGMREWVHVGQR